MKHYLTRVARLKWFSQALTGNFNCLKFLQIYLIFTLGENMSLTVPNSTSNRNLAVIANADLTDSDVLRNILLQMVSAGDAKAKDLTRQVNALNGIVFDQKEKINELDQFVQKMESENNKLKKERYRERADQALKKIRSNLSAAKGGNVALQVFGWSTVVIGVGIGPLLASECGVKPEIIRLKKERWIHENFPEAVDAKFSQEARVVREKALRIIGHYYEQKKELNEEMRSLEAMRQGDHDDASLKDHYTILQEIDRDIDKVLEEKAELRHAKKNAQKELRKEVDAIFYPQIKV